jgi:hypothetical protein
VRGSTAKIRHARGDVVLDTLGGDLPGDLRVQEVGGSDDDFLSAGVVLVCPQHMFVKDVHGDLVDERVGDPCAIMASLDLTQLVCANFGHCDLVRLFVLLNGDLGGHTTHSGNTTPITR